MKFMKLNNEFISHEEGTETFVIPSGKANFSGVVRGNKTFGNVVELLQNDITEAEIVRIMLEKYDASQDVIERDVKKVIENLREIGAIID